MYLSNPLNVILHFRIGSHILNFSPPPLQELLLLLRRVVSGCPKTQGTSNKSTEMYINTAFFKKVLVKIHNFKNVILHDYLIQNFYVTAHWDLICNMSAISVLLLCWNIDDTVLEKFSVNCLTKKKKNITEISAIRVFRLSQ